MNKEKSNVYCYLIPPLERLQSFPIKPGIPCQHISPRNKYLCQILAKNTKSETTDDSLKDKF